MSLFDTISSSISRGVNKAISGLSASSIAKAAANRAIGKYAPAAMNTINALQKGDVFGAAMSGLDALRMKAGVKSPLWNPLIADLLYNGKGSRLRGGITAADAARMANDIFATSYAKSNVWYIQLEDWNPPGGDISAAFNMFATDVSFGPDTITSETKNIGMGVMDHVTGTERTQMRITTLDDAQGTLKSWFEGKCNQISHSDGTAGLPIEYLVTIRILHSAVNDAAMLDFGGYRQSFVMRPGQIDMELSRSEDGLQKLQMTFDQFDTFVFGDI